MGSISQDGLGQQFSKCGLWPLISIRWKLVRNTNSYYNQKPRVRPISLYNRTVRVLTQSSHPCLHSRTTGLGYVVAIKFSGFQQKFTSCSCYMSNRAVYGSRPCHLYFWPEGDGEVSVQICWLSEQEKKRI